MRYFTERYFTNRFPGPFAIARNHDGVDETYDIYCLSSENFIAATYFWEDEQASYMEADAIATALNLSLHPETVGADEKTRCLEFLLQSALPITVKSSKCPYRGPCWDVLCNTGLDTILSCYGPKFSLEPIAIAMMVRQALSEASKAMTVTDHCPDFQWS